MKKIASALLMALSVMLFASTAFAQAGDPGFDVRIGLAGSYMKAVSSSSVSASMGDFSYDSGDREGTTFDLGGLNAKIALGMRWTYFGVYLEQDLGGVWLQSAKYGDKEYDATDEDRDGMTKFLGGSYAVFRGIIPIQDRFQLELGFGLGVMYSGGDKAKDSFNDDYKSPLIVNKDGDPSVAFAMKAAFAFNYYFTSNVAAGLFLDYNIGLKTNKVSYESGWEEYTGKQKLKAHQINPGLQVMMRF